MSKESRLVKNTAIIAIGNLCTKGISFLLLPLYTSLLTTEDYGTVDVIATYTSLLTIVLTLQLEQGIFRFLVEMRENQQKQKEYVTTAMLTVFLLLGITIPLGYFALSRNHYPYTGYLLTNIVVSILNSIILQIPRGFGDNLTYAIGSFISGASTIILNVLFIAIFRYGLEGMIASGILGLAFCSVFVACRVRLHKYLSVRSFNTECWKKLMRYSLPLIPYTICFWLINASDRAIIKMTIGMVYNGIYAVAYKFPSIFSMASNIFQLAWMESTFETADDAERNNFYQKTINSAVRFYSSCNLGIIALVPFVFSVMVNADFHDAYHYIPILMTATMFHAVSALYGAIYFAFKRTDRVALSTAAAAGLNVAMNILLIGRFGLYAAAASTLIAYLVMVMNRYYETKKNIGVVISWKYMILEAIAYVLVFGAYYLKNTLLQVITLCWLVPYCVINNKELLCNLTRGLISRIRTRK